MKSIIFNLDEFDLLREDTSYEEVFHVPQNVMGNLRTSLNEVTIGNKLCKSHSLKGGLKRNEKQKTFSDFVKSIFDFFNFWSYGTK